MRRIFGSAKRAMVRTFRRVLLAHIDYQLKHSDSEIRRLGDFSRDIKELVGNEHRRQVRLMQQRQRIERA